MDKVARYARVDILFAVEHAAVHFLERLRARRTRLEETLERKQAMDDYRAYVNDMLARLKNAGYSLIDAQGRMHREPPPWSGVESFIESALSDLHIARVHLAAARYSYAKAIHEATVGQFNDSSDDQDELGDDLT